MHDSHEPSYRIVQPQACIDELRADLEAVLDNACEHPADLDGAGVNAVNKARDTLERTKP